MVPKKRLLTQIIGQWTFASPLSTAERLKCYEVTKKDTLKCSNHEQHAFYTSSHSKAFSISIPPLNALKTAKLKLRTLLNQTTQVEDNLYRSKGKERMTARLRRSPPIASENKIRGARLSALRPATLSRVHTERNGVLKFVCFLPSSAGFSS